MLLTYNLIVIQGTYDLTENKRISISLIVGIIYAISDEIHQGFIPGRAAKITDVMIDTMGVAVGILVLLLILTIINKIKIKDTIKE
jgi:VanZ family protein